MYTVIIPTMWRGEHFRKMLPFVHGHPLVGEIILINNAGGVTPDWFRSQVWSKIEEIDLGTNIFVNPAWELGISRSNHDNICLMSDDVGFDHKVFDFLHNKLAPQFGCIGPDASSIMGAVNGPMAQITIDKPGYGYGTLLFLNKQNFTCIPRELKIFYGDNWIFNTHVRAGKKPRSILNLNITTKLETTSGSKEFLGQVYLEHQHWNNNIRNQ